MSSYPENLECVTHSRLKCTGGCKITGKGLKFSTVDENIYFLGWNRDIKKEAEVNWIPQHFTIYLLFIF